MRVGSNPWFRAQVVQVRVTAAVESTNVPSMSNRIASTSKRRGGADVVRGRACLERVAGSSIVLINRDVEGVDCDRVIADNRAGGAAVAEFLHSRGRTDAALIAGSGAANTSRDRQESFLAQMCELGQEVPEHLRFEGGFSHDLAAQLARRLLTRGAKPNAIFCVNDNMAFGAPTPFENSP